jgi:hypothetical protein
MEIENENEAFTLRLQQSQQTSSVNLKQITYSKTSYYLYSTFYCREVSQLPLIK